MGDGVLNGDVTHPGTAAEGLLLNVRMVNVVFEDANRPEFDPEANTAEFISWIPDYAAHGVNAFTISLQGGMPGYEGAVNSAFEPDGSLRPAYLERVERVIRACDRHGVVVILSLYYQRQSCILRDGAAVRAGLVNVARWVNQRGFQNLLLEIANEYPPVFGFRSRSHPRFPRTGRSDSTGERDCSRVARLRQRLRGWQDRSRSGRGSGFPAAALEWDQGGGDTGACGGVEAVG